MARGELYVQLVVEYADDEKFEKVSRNSRLLFVDALCFSKKLLNDGRISPAQVHKLMYPESKRAAERAAAELVGAGLWAWDDEHQNFVICAWLKRNKSRSQVLQDRSEAEENALLGNHQRWHVDRGRPDSACRLCRDEQPGTGSGTRSSPRSGGQYRSESPETETETETETKAEAHPLFPPRDAATPAPEPDASKSEESFTETVVAEWIDGCRERPPADIIRDVRRKVADMLHEQTRPDHIRRGILAWQHAPGTWHPNTLPMFVHRAMNASAPAGPDPGRYSTTDQRVTDALALSEHMQAEHDRRALSS